MKSVSLLLVLGLGAAMFAGASCGGNPPPRNPTPNADSAAAAEKARQDSIAAAQAEADRRSREEAERVARQREADSLAALSRTSDEVKATLATMIHFDYDKSNIRSDDAATLDQKVAILQANPNLRIRVGGHCDERGSDEYNLALGNRRAQAAKQYRVSHGIDAGRIETQSWGEEKPLVQGHDESAWSQNRRDEFEIISGGDQLRRGS
jgi:peptidoglycan-associated lipoprotein